jgi:hypothetical protein
VSTRTEETCAYFIPKPSDARVCFGVGDTTVEVGTLVLREWHGVRIRGDAIPDVLDDLEMLSLRISESGSVAMAER